LQKAHEISREVHPETPEAERGRSTTVVTETIRIDRPQKVEREIDEADDHVITQCSLDQHLPMSIEKHQYDQRADYRRDFDTEQDAEFERVGH
jgi:hypothetical protein